MVLVCVFLRLVVLTVSVDHAGSVLYFVADDKVKALAAEKKKLVEEVSWTFLILL